MPLIAETPSVVLLATAVVFYISGAVTPFYYTMERLRGFGRWIAQRIPYSAPPGEDAGQAMQAAVEAGERSPDGEEAER